MQQDARSNAPVSLLAECSARADVKLEYFTPTRGTDPSMRDHSNTPPIPMQRGREGKRCWRILVEFPWLTFFLMFVYLCAWVMILLVSSLYCCLASLLVKTSASWFELDTQRIAISPLRTDSRT